MPDFFVNGHPVHAEKGQTVMQAALAAGFYIPYFCWHPNLSIAGNCRVCVVEVEGEGGGGSWMEIACNMPVTEGMRVLTDSPAVQERRRQTLQFILLNHPVDCGICDKAGECLLQDHHFEYNGLPSISTVPKVKATKYFPLSQRIVLDNERCILCSRCVRFTREVSKTHALGIQHRGDSSLVRATEEGALDRDPYSDNVIDICPVGALLSKSFLHKARVWYLQPTRSVCPGCSRGCHVDLWHRKAEWKLNALDPRQNTSIARVTPPPAQTGAAPDEAPNGPWICNTGRDLARFFERPRALQPMAKGREVAQHAAFEAARRMIAEAKRPVALVSSWGSNEELAALAHLLARPANAKFTAFVKADRQAEPGEVAEDAILIRADKNPNSTGARKLFGSAPVAFPADTDLVLVWGEGVAFGDLPRGARVIFLNAFLQPENGHADVFIPVSVQTERAGSYTNGDGLVSRFEACFEKQASVAHAEQVFAALEAPTAALLTASA
jgi:NADH-quinone oxidoreductase subunit G